MKNISRTLAVAVAVLCCALTAQASTRFTARLTGTQETPPTGSAATGTGTVVLNDAEDSITYTLTFAGLGSAQTLAHIHAPAAPGATASPIIDIGANGQTSGTFTGSSAVTAQQVADLKGGLWYFNVHTSTFPNGEIRGQIQPSALISEFRFRGAAGGNDEFIEVYNNSDESVTVSVSDGSAGWAVVGANTAAAPAVSARFVIPNGTVIPARGHFLATNSGAAGYSLGGYAAGDITYATGVVDGGSIGLFRTSTAANFTDAFRLDAVGFTAPAGGTASFVEGGGLTPANGVTTNGEYGFVRRQSAGTPRDTDNNQNDFDFVSVTGGTFTTRVSTLGAPGPENLASPVQRNAQFKGSLIDPLCAGTRTNPAAPSACARERNTAAVTNGAAGTLAIRRKFTNNTGAAVTRLRFRIVDITTLNSPVTTTPPQAVLRVLTSTQQAGTCTDEAGNAHPCPGGAAQVDIQGLALEQPPTQPNGGGLNSSVSLGSITLATPLAAGNTVDVQFLLGVEVTGSFRFLVNIEALPGPTDPPVAVRPVPARTVSAGKAVAHTHAHKK